MENQVKEYDKVEAALAEYTEEYKGVVYDCTVPAEMKVAKHAKQLFVKARTGLERIRVKVKAKALAHCKAVDSEANRITASLKELEEPIGAQIKIETDRKAAVKAEKAAKIEKARQRWVDIIEAIKRRPLDYISASPEQIADALEKARGKSTDDFPEDLADEAFEALQSAIKKLEEMHGAALKRVKMERRVEEVGDGSGSGAGGFPKATPVSIKLNPGETAVIGREGQSEVSVIPCTVGKEGEIMPLGGADGHGISNSAEVTIGHHGLSMAGAKGETDIDKVVREGSDKRAVWQTLFDCAKPACDLLEQSPFTRDQDATKNLRAAITAATELT